MYMLLGDMYGTMFEEGALQAPEVAQAFQRWVCPAIRSPYIPLATIREYFHNRSTGLR